MEINHKKEGKLHGLPLSENVSISLIPKWLEGVISCDPGKIRDFWAVEGCACPAVNN